MNAKIKDKILNIERYLSEFETIIPANLSDYVSDFKTKAACERYFEKIIEAVVDLAFLILNELNEIIPEEDKQAFDILFNHGIITWQLSQRLKEAKGMRNIISHQYGNVDDEVVFESITKELCMDTSEFLSIIKQKFS